MKQKIQGLIAGILLGTLGTSGIAYARSGSEWIEAIYSDIKLYVNGAKIDTSENEPFIYNGSTYLPVRAVAEALGESVEWDGNTKSIYIGKSSTLKPYTGEWMSEDDFRMGGKLYSGFSLHNNLRGYALFNLNGNYSTINMKIGPTDTSDCSDIMTVNFYLDGTKVDSIELTKTSYPRDYSLSLNGALQLKVELVAETIYTEVGFGDITVK